MDSMKKALIHAGGGEEAAEHFLINFMAIEDPEETPAR